MDIDRQDNVDFAYQIVESDDILGMVYYAMDNHDEMSSKRKKQLSITYIRLMGMHHLD